MYMRVNLSADPPLWGVTRLRGISFILHHRLYPVSMLYFGPVVNGLWQYWMLDGAASTALNYPQMVFPKSVAPPPRVPFSIII